MPKLLIISTFYDPFLSGAEIAVKHRLPAFSDKYKTTILTAKIKKDLPRQENKDWIKIIRIGIGCKYDKYLFPLLATIFMLRKKYDIYLAVLESFAWLALALASKCKKSIHNKWILNLQSWTLDDPKGIRKYIFKFIHQTPKYITAISHSLVKRAQERGSKAYIEIIPNGVDLNKFKHNPQIHKKNFISIWRLHPVKWFDKLFLVRKNLINQGYDYHLSIIGDGNLRKKLEQQTKTLKLEKHIQFLGFLPHEQIIQKLQKAQYFILNSQKEGLWNVFIEAAACGCILIGPKVGGIPDIIQHDENGWMYPAWDLNKLEQLLKSLQKRDSKKLEEKTHYAPTSIQKFNRKHIQNAYLKLFSKITDHKASLSSNVEEK